MKNFKLDDIVFSHSFGVGKVINITYNTEHPIRVHFFKDGTRNTFSELGVYDNIPDNSKDIVHISSINIKQVESTPVIDNYYEIIGKIVKIDELEILITKNTPIILPKKLPKEDL